MTNIESYNLGRLIAAVEVCISTPKEFAALAIKNPMQKLLPKFIEASKQAAQQPDDTQNAIIMAIVSNLPADPFPPRLTIAEANAAWVGYYKQRARLTDPKAIRHAIGQKILEARTKAGLSQQQLADLAGIDRTNVTKIETGLYNVTLDTLSRIGTALGLDVDLISSEVSKIPQGQSSHTSNDC